MAPIEEDWPHAVPHDPITTWPQLSAEKGMPDPKAEHPLAGQHPRSWLVIDGGM